MPPLSLCLVFISLLVLGISSEKCAHPSVRKEWRTLSRQDRGQWITAVTDTSTGNPGNIAPYNASGSLFDDIVYAHMDLNHHIHITGLFFPWHRWYVYGFDAALRNRCGYRGPSPYWDWTQDASDFFNSPFFQDSDPVSGLGGWGVPDMQFRVVDGAFSASSGFQLAYPFPHTLRRNFTLYPPMQELFPFPDFLWNQTCTANESFTKPVVQSLIDGYIGDFKGMQAKMEGVDGPHANVHFMVNGDLGGACPSDAPPGCTPGPTFPQRLQMVDRIWFKWQKKHDLNKNAFEGGSVQRLDNASIYALYPNGGPPMLTMDSAIPTNGLSSTFTVSDIIDTTGGPLCYIYD
ncbi:Di-copper centre-containing protein [Mycena crocata]|nr:Di-copper centre-containing protein [Mycena crocata]